MTDSVNTDVLRALAADCNEKNYDADNGFLLGSSGDAFNAAADEVDQLRGALRAAANQLEAVKQYVTEGEVEDDHGQQVVYTHNLRPLIGLRNRESND